MRVPMGASLALYWGMGAVNRTICDMLCWEDAPFPALRPELEDLSSHFLQPPRSMRYAG